MKKIIKNLCILSLMLVSVLGLAACDKKQDAYDDITKELKLSKDYEGKDFIKDGVGKATLSHTTDGDTATFVLASGEQVTIRFHGIDTPESTGFVEKWGKSASKFTENILKNAESFVLDSPTTPAQVDSYGERYLGYVWYRNSKKDSWKNLNLQIVENGFSEDNCFQDAIYPYASYFAKAEKFAKSKLLHIWSKDEDPYYTTKAMEVTIKEINTNEAKYYDEKEDAGAKVRIQAYIISMEEGQTGTYTYRAAQWDENGERHTINIYAGYISSGIPSYLKIGGKYSMTGSIQKRNGNLQIGGLTYVPLENGGDYLYSIEDNAYLQFDSSIKYHTDYAESLYGDVKITSIKKEADGSFVIEGDAMLKMAEVNTELTKLKFKVPASAISEEDYNSLVGRKFCGVGTRDGEFVKINNAQDFRLRAK